ncbi:hypothetical protein ACQPVP_13875 [Clostridium nigeriense]|uniref:hypothetical protein n=1 Tax=Clostridium nigeriense TaxID=1805470 RepID=UPI003D344AB3
MYYNNLNRQQEYDDLKFMPLNIREPFLDKDSSWFPIIDMALPTFSELSNNFLLGFATPVDNSNLQGNSLKTLDFIQNNNLNVQNAQNNQSAEDFTKDFNLEYPSETLSEELYSYNKDEGCKSINNSTNNMNMENTNMPNINMQNMNMQNMNNNKGNQDEPIHMNLLRNFNFEFYLDNSYRGESSNQIEEIDRIFNVIKGDNSIVETFKAYNIPKPISNLIIKKIIKITLENSKSKWGE